MKKSLIFVGMLTIGYINAQYDGKVGINTESPSATLNVKTKTDATSPKNLELENQTGTKLVTVLNRNGNVGINTETPTDKLHVKDGAIRVEAGGSTGGYLNIINSSKPTGTQDVMSMWTLYNMTGSYGNSLQFWGYRDVAGAGANAVQNVLVLQDTGNIGIGLRDPQEKLDVNGKVRVRNLFANAGADTDKVVVVDNTGVLKTIARTDFANATSVTDATEWVYDDTTKQIKLKRSGTLFGNTVFYNKNGALLNYDLTSYKWFNVNNGTTPTETLDFANYLGNALYRKTSSINFGTSKSYDMNEEMLYVDSTTSADMNILGRSSSVYISPDNTKNYQIVRGIKGNANHYGTGNVKYLIGGYFDGRLERGSSDSYVFGVRATANYGTNKTSKQQTGVGIFNQTAAQSGGTITNMIDVDAYKSFANSSPLAVTNMKGFYAKNNLVAATGKVSITNAIGFDYDGLDLTNSTHSVENNYGLHIGNIAGGTASNYAIYTNVGKVRFGDNVGVGVNNPNEKLEVSGAIKVANTSNTCTSTNVGTIKFENDNFYGCKSTGWVLLNN